MYFFKAPTYIFSRHMTRLISRVGKPMSNGWRRCTAGETLKVFFYALVLALSRLVSGVK